MWGDRVSRDGRPENQELQICLLLFCQPISLTDTDLSGSTASMTTGAMFVIKWDKEAEKAAQSVEGLNDSNSADVSRSGSAVERGSATDIHARDVAVTEEGTSSTIVMLRTSVKAVDA